MTPDVKFEPCTSGLWWCNSHRRRATHVASGGGYGAGKHVCDPKLGGILLPCFAVDLTGLVEIEDA